MSLLIFAATARLEEPAGRELDAFLRALSSALPRRFALPITPAPPEQTHPENSWDWATVPERAAPEVQLELLSRYAAWLKPTVTLFFGEGARQWHGNCDSAVFGLRWLANGLTPDELIAQLRPRLPLLLVLDEQLDLQTAKTALESCDEFTPLHVHCPKSLGLENRELLRAIAEYAPGSVQLFLPLKHALLLSRTAPADVAFLLRNKGRIELTIYDEIGTPLPGVLNRIWSPLGPAR